MRLRPWAGIAQMSRARSLTRLDCWSCSAAGWAETRTPLRHRRDTSRIPAAGRAPTSRASFPKPDETASPPRAHPPASARGQTIRALPWEDANARLLRLGIKGGSTTSCTRAFPYSPTVARFDPRQAGQTPNHGFPRWPVHKPSFRKKQAIGCSFHRSETTERRVFTDGELFRYSVGVFLAIAKNPTVIILGFHPRDSGSSPDSGIFFCFLRPRACVRAPARVWGPWGLCARAARVWGLWGVVCLWGFGAGWGARGRVWGGGDEGGGWWV